MVWYAYKDRFKPHSTLSNVEPMCPDLTTDSVLTSIGERVNTTCWSMWIIALKITQQDVIFKTYFMFGTDFFTIHHGSCVHLYRTSNETCWEIPSTEKQPIVLHSPATRTDGSRWVLSFWSIFSTFPLLLHIVISVKWNSAIGWQKSFY